MAAGASKAPPWKGLKWTEWKTKIKYQGVFYYLMFYREMYEMLKDLNYTTEEFRRYMEKYYYEKSSLHPKEAMSRWLWWRAHKEGEEGSTYYLYLLDVDVHGRFIKDVEVMYDNEKMTAQRAEVEVFITASVLIDRHGTWQEHWLLKHLHELFYKRIWRRQLDDHLHEVKLDAMKFQRMIKEFFNLQHYVQREGRGPFAHPSGILEKGKL